MKKYISTIILLILISPISLADFSYANIKKCKTANGRVSYYPVDTKLPANCVESKLFEWNTPEYEAQRQAWIREDARQARLEYRERVRSTAKFLDDVEALRRKKK